MLYMKRFLLTFLACLVFLLNLGFFNPDLEEKLLGEKKIEIELKDVKKRKAFIPDNQKEKIHRPRKKTNKKIVKTAKTENIKKDRQKSFKQQNKNLGRKKAQPQVQITKKQNKAVIRKGCLPTEASQFIQTQNADKQDSVARNVRQLPSKSASPSHRSFSGKEPAPKVDKSAPRSKNFEPDSNFFQKRKTEPPAARRAPKEEASKSQKKSSSPQLNVKPSLQKAPKQEDFQKQKERDFSGIRASPSNRLKGLIFIRDLSKLVPDPAIYPPGIVLKDMHVRKEEAFLSRMKRFLNKPINTDLLLQIKEAVVRHYWNTGGPLIRVFVPAAQDISSGKIQFYIRHSVLGILNVNAGKNTPEEKIKEEISVKPGDEIYTGDLLDDKDWLENDPFRSVDIIYEPGELLGTTDIIIGVEERRPLHCYAGMEISSYKTASSNRYKVGFSKGHLFKQSNQQLNAEIIVSPYIKKWNSISANYLLALPKRQRFKVFGSYVRTKPQWWEIEMPEYLSARGLSYAIGGRYEFRLPHFGFYFHLLQLGYDFKRSNSYVDYFGTIFGRSIDVSQFLLRYEGAMKGARGSTNFGISWYMSPGRMMAFNHNKQYHLNRANTKCRYMYGIFNLDHYVHFPIKATWITNLIMQFTGSRLVGLEEFSLGGKLTVRGYAEGEAIGDFGLLIKNEIRTNPFPLVRLFKDSLQMLAFVDFGYVNDVNQNVLSKKSAILLSIGPGFRYMVSSYLNIRFDLGFQCKPVHGQVFGKPLKRHGYLGAYLTY